MHFKRLAVAVIGASCLAGSAALAQDAPQIALPNSSPDTPQNAPPAASATLPQAPPVVVIPKGTPIVVEITDLVSTRTARRDDWFNLKLAAPVMQDGAIVIPAGTPGKGQVIDAAKPGMGGKPGKLVLAGRYLDFDGQQIPIRGLNMAMDAKSNTGTAMAASVVVGVFGLAVTGGNMEVQPGTHANAKLGADFTPSAPAAPPQDDPTATPQASQQISGD